MTQKEIFETLTQSGHLPQLPQVMVRLIKACSNDQTDIDELTAIISTDPGISTKLMQIIGSPYMNLPGEINSIKSAVLYLGVETIKNIAVSTSAMHFFNLTKSVPEFNINQFWFHSYACGVLAQKIAVESDIPGSDEYFLAGLLHDIGRLVLLDNFSDQYKKILSSSSTELQILEMESQLFDATTPEISEWVFRKWQLNPLLADAILYVNEPNEAIISALDPVKIIYTANQLASQKPLEHLPKLSSLLNLSPARLEAITDEAEEEVMEMANSMGIRVDDSTDDASEKELAARMKSLSIFYGTLENLLQAKDRDTILNTVQNGLKIIFNINRVFFFFPDEKKQYLMGLSPQNDKSRHIVKNIALPLSSPLSIISACARENKVQNSFKRTDKEKIALSDTQIARLLEKDGLYCIPLVSSQKHLGTMVLGVDETAAHHIENQKELVSLFSRQTGICLDNITFYQDIGSQLHEKKMQAYSFMTDKIIHEINNPVTIVKSYIQTLGFKLPDKHPAQEELGIINEEMTRVAGLLGKLKSFSRPPVDEFEFIDLNHTCQTIFNIIEKSILLPRQIAGELRLDSEIPQVKTDINGLKQIFINLVKNAAEALETPGESKGKITISTRFLSHSAKILIDEKKKIPGKIEIEISDNGPGIDEGLRQRLFEPYTTTKDQASNSGLGLSIVHAIVKELNGNITCKSVKGKGTSFVITLPVSSTKKQP